MSVRHSFVPPSESPPSLDTPEDCFEEDRSDSLLTAGGEPREIEEFEENRTIIGDCPKIKDKLDSPTEESALFMNRDNSDEMLSNKLDNLYDRTRNTINDDNTLRNANRNYESKDERITSTISSEEEEGRYLCETAKSDSANKLMSTLTLTEDHPLMCVSSPDSPTHAALNPGFPNGGPMVSNGSSSPMNSSSNATECECFVDKSPLTNGDSSSHNLHAESFARSCEPQRNTSKNNLYFSENFVVCEESSNSVDGLADIMRSDDRFDRSPKAEISTPKNDTRQRANFTLNTSSFASPISRNEKVSDFPDSPSQLRKVLKYELPVEHPSTVFEDLPSPDSSTASRPENEKSLYQAEVDPYGGCVTLKPKPPGSAANTSKRKRIKPQLTETDVESVALSANPTLFVSCQNELSGSASSLDTISNGSMQSDSCNDLKNIGPNKIDLENVPLASDLKRDDSINDGSETETETEGGYRGKPLKSEGPLTIAEKIKEYSLAEERLDSRLWLKVTLPSGEQRTIDMKVIEPYKRVLSHGGYALSGRRDAIVVFSACYLPDSSRVDYNYVMDNLFLYVLTTLEQLVTDDYILIYLHGSASKRSMPTFHWLKKCYQLVDRRLRKSLKHLYLVHPTFWLKSIMWMTRPFISSKFARKLSYVYNLEELENLVPVEQAAIPEKVRRYDSRRT